MWITGNLLGWQYCERMKGNRSFVQLDQVSRDLFIKAIGLNVFEFGRSVGHILDVYSSGISDGSGLVEEEEPPCWEKLMFNVRDERSNTVS